MSTFLGVNKPSRLHHVDCSSLGPFVDFIPFHTLVSGGIGYGDQAVRRPLEGDEANIAVTHGCLTKKVEAVF